MGFEVGFVPIELTNETLTGMRKLAIKEGLHRAPAFAQWLADWCQNEAIARIKTPDKRLQKHAIGLPPVTKWTDSQLADALGFAMILSYQPGIPADAGNFVDRIAVCLTQLAADRLRERDPAKP